MPVREPTTTSVDQRLVKVYEATAVNAGQEIGHIYEATAADAFDTLFVAPALPRITSFTLTPESETMQQRQARGASPMLAAAWAVDPTTPAQTGRSYNYGTVLTAATSPAHRTGWSIQHTLGSVSVQPTIGRVSFITYFESVPGTTVGPDLNTRYFVRNDFNQLTDQTLATPRAIEVNGVSYPLSPRPTGSGYTSAAGVPAFVAGGTYNIQVKVGGTAGDASTWQDAFPNTLTATTPSTSAVYPTLAMTFVTADGVSTPVSVVQGGTGSANIPTPTQDGVARLAATNIEGTVSARARYDLRTALSGLSLTNLGNVPQVGVNQNVQIQPRLRARFTGDPISSATLGVPGSDTPSVDLLRNARPTGAAYDITRTFTLALGDQQRTVTATLTVVGVSTVNVQLLQTATATITVPARAGG